MKLMAHSDDDDLRFQCYLLEGEEDAEIFTLGAHRNQKEFCIDKKCLCDNDERYFILWDAQSKSIIGKTIIWFRPNLAPRFTGMEISVYDRKQNLSQFLHQASIRYLQELGFTGYVDANIDTDKVASFKAALGNGFEVVDTDECSYHSLTRKIEKPKLDERLELARRTI